MHRLRLDDFLVVKKKSRLEVDAMQLELIWSKIKEGDETTLHKVLKRYHDNSFIQRNLDAMRELYSFIDFLEEIGFDNENIIEREELDLDNIKSKKAIISVGGDNHLIWVSNQLEYLGLDIPIIGCNSNVVGSVGGILYDNLDTLKETLRKCEKGNYSIEEWPKIEGKIFFNNKKVKLFPATQEYILGEYVGTQNSRWFLINHEEQRGNRLIITNGVGSTGWYNSTHKSLFGCSDAYSKTSRELRHIIEGPSGNPKIFM